jgi:hypothetical protein
MAAYHRETSFSKPVSRRMILRGGAGVLGALTLDAGALVTLQGGPAFAKQGSDNVVLQWNSAALQAVRDVNPGPTVASRAIAIMHTAMYDAWAAFDPVAVPTRPNGIPRHPGSGRSLGNKNQAISYAAYRAMLDLFPSDAALFQNLMSSLGYNPSDTSTDTSSPTGVGNVAAQAVLSFRHGDGSNQLNGYADTSNYQPVNTPDQIIDPLHWQPLRVNGKVQKYLTPHWGAVTPFALSSGSQFRPAGGPVMSTSDPAYKSQVDTILNYSANLNDTTKTTADYWANGPHSETPPGHWMLFSQFASAQFVSHRNKTDPNNDVKLFFALSNAVFDAGIACWDCKRAFDYGRPITAVHYLYANQQVTAWGGIGQGSVSMLGSQWMPYQESIVVTPPFPEYCSGHSTFSAAGAYVMQQFTGSDSFGDSFTAAPGSSQIEPGIAPAAAVTLSWPTFSAAAAQAGISRQIGGIHFNQGDQDGRTLGRQVAAVTWARAQSYINGTG